MNKTILVTIAAVALLGLVPNTLADGDGAGLSGQCYNADASEGGQDEARVYTDGHIIVLPGTTSDGDLTDNRGGAAPALVLFATETVNDGGQTAKACKRYDCFSTAECDGRPERYDYLEVDARFGAVFVQVCYNGGLDLSGSCPTSPTGPGF